MAKQTINGTDGTADLTIDADGSGAGAPVSYKSILTRFDLDVGQEQIDVTTFNEEGTTKNDPGRLVVGFSIAGLLTKGDPASGPLIPPPQHAAIVFTFSTGCTITLSSANFNRCTVTRIVNTNGLITGSGVSDGSITKVWVTS